MRYLEALKFAEVMHGNQMYGNKPYMYHVQQVVANAIKYNGTDDEIVAAALHDVLEDTQCRYEMIAERFGDNVAAIVLSVTNLEDENGKTLREATYKRVLSHPSGTFVKLCDRLANVSNAEKNDMYKKQYPLFKKMLYNVNDDKCVMLWYLIDHILQG